MALTVKTGGIDNKKYSTPVKMFKKVFIDDENGNPVPTFKEIVKVYFNEREMSFQEFQKLESQLSTTKRGLDEKISNPDTPIDIKNQLIATKKLVEIEQAELSKQLNLVQTQKLLKKGLIQGANLIITLESITKDMEIGYRVLEIVQKEATLIHPDLIFNNKTDPIYDYKYYGRYYRIVNIQERDINLEINSLKNKLGENSINIYNLTVKEAIKLLSNYISNATTNLTIKINNMDAQQKYIERNLPEAINAINTYPTMLEQNIQKNNTDLDNNKKIGDLLKSTLKTENLQTVTVNDTIIVQAQANITNQKELITKISNNVLELENEASQTINTNLSSLATKAAELFIIKETVSDPDTGEEVIITTDTLQTIEENITSTIQVAIPTEPTFKIEYGFSVKEIEQGWTMDILMLENIQSLLNYNFTKINTTDTNTQALDNMLITSVLKAI